MEAPPSDAPATGDAPISERPALGGRDVDERGVNSGLLRCPRCLSRLVSCRGRLRERQGPDASFWVPHRPAETASGAPASEGTGAPAEAGDVPEEEAWEWTEHQHAWWWEMADMEEVDNGGLSRLVTSPAGPLKLIMCCECNYGPFGYQRESEPRLWLCCELLHQQDASLARNEEDFRVPDGLDMSMLQSMIDSGMATVQYHVAFAEQRLGMMLADAADGDGVEVVAFTEADGQLGPAELSGQVAIGDKVARVGGTSTRGLDYAAVLDMVIDAPRPVTIHFERKGARPQGDPARILHEEWRGPPPPDGGAGGGGEPE